MFIALNIDNNIPVSTNFFDSFFYAVSTALMILARHNSFTAKCFYNFENSLIVCCNIGCFERSCYFLINMLYHWFAT